MATTDSEVVKVKAVTLALTETWLEQSEIPMRIPPMFDLVYEWLRASPAVEQTGRNYAIYDRFSAGHMRMRVGFPVSRQFTATDKVQCSELTAGRAAHIAYRGPYDGLSDAHTRLRAWCLAERLQLAGESWEVYGHWTDDVSQLLTDVYLRLA